MKRIAIVSVVAAATAIAAAPALAANRVYWTNYGSSTLSYANLDGTGHGGQLNTSPTTPNGPIGDALDPATNKIYWPDTNDGTISFANLGGSGGATLDTAPVTPANPRGVAVDPATNKIYWINHVADTIMFANLDDTGGGGTLNTPGATISSPYGLAIDPALNKIYWTNFTGSIGFASLDGSGGGTLNTSGATLSGPNGVAIDSANGKIYWANRSNDTISFANVNDTGGGGQLNIAGSMASGPEGVAIDPSAGKIYWVNDNNDSVPVSYAKLNGTGGAPLATTGATATEAEFPVLLESPLGTGAPTVTGGSAPGSTLSCSAGSWASDLIEALLYRAPQTFTYSWTLNGSPIGGATSSTIHPTPAGDYACKLTAANAAGATTQTSASHAILAGIENLKAKIKSAKHTAKIVFKANTTGATGFQCALIKKKKHHKKAKPHFASCKSPATYKHLKPGKYTFEVRALSSAGPGPAASKSFKIG